MYGLKTVPFTPRLTHFKTTRFSAAICMALHLQKVADHLMSAVGENALRVELHALDGQGAMTQAHDDRAAALRRARGNRQTGGQRLLGHNQRVIASTRQRRVESREDALAVVRDRAGFA